MSSYAILPDGKYEVYFAGNLIECTTDADCPENAHCLLNATWSAHPSMCACMYNFGAVGDSCSEVMPVWGSALIFLSSIAIAMCTLIIAALCIDAVRMRRYLAKNPCTAFSTTLVFTILSAGSILLYGCILISRSHGVTSQAFHNVAIMFLFCFISLSLLNVSLVWLDIIYAVAKMSQRAHRNIYRYRMVLIVYYLAFVVALIYFIAKALVQDSTTNNVATYIAIPAVAYMVVTYLVVYFRIHALFLRDKSSSSGNAKDAAPVVNGNSPAVDAKSPKTQVMTKIANTSLAVSLCLIGGLMFLVIALALGGASNGNYPDRTPAEVIQRFLWIFVGLANAIVARYLHSITNGQLSSSKSIRVVSSGHAKSEKVNTTGTAAIVAVERVTESEVTSAN